ncbi:MAG: glycosyltransferase, partial [Bacteroidota bacterium]
MEAEIHNRTEQKIMLNWKDSSDIPVVSVCCTAYNHEHYIGEAIDGFLMQETDFPFEILIHDDCSTDETAKIIRNYEKKYPNIIKPIYQRENQYSKGIRVNPIFNFLRAKGKYIALCEGDDYWIDPLKLQNQIEFLEKNDEYSMCYHSRIHVDSNSKIIDHVCLEPNTDYSEKELISGIAVPMTNTIVFRNIIDPSFYKLKAFSGDILLLHYLGFYGK